jgi:hypothetical protein
MAVTMKSTAGHREEAIQACLDGIMQIVGKGEAEVVLYAEKGIRRFPRGSAPIEEQEGRDEIDRWLEEHRTALLVNNLTHDVRFTHEFGRSRRIVSVVAVPLAWAGALRGTLRLTSVVPQAFLHDDLRFASDAAGMLVPLIFRSG